MTNKEVYKELSKPIPEDFVFHYKHGNKELTGYEAQYAINLLNETLGLDGWSREDEILQQGQRGSDWVVIIKTKLEINSDNKLIEVIGYGGGFSRNAEDAYKAASSNALKNACRYLGIGKELYTDNIKEDKVEETDGFTTVADTTFTERILACKNKEQLKSLETLILKIGDKKTKDLVIEEYNKQLIKVS